MSFQRQVPSHEDAVAAAIAIASGHLTPRSSPQSKKALKGKVPSMKLNEARGGRVPEDWVVISPTIERHSNAIRTPF